MASHTDPVLGAPPAQCALVLGAPGSGKTTLLVDRLVALSAQGVSPDALLIVTPTNPLCLVASAFLAVVLSKQVVSLPTKVK